MEEAIEQTDKDHTNPRSGSNTDSSGSESDDDDYEPSDEDDDRSSDAGEDEDAEWLDVDEMYGPGNSDDGL
jgi:hypothetical protein